MAGPGSATKGRVERTGARLKRFPRRVVKRVPRTLGAIRPRTRRVLARAGLPPRMFWPYTLPGAARLHQLRWAWMLRRSHAITPEEHAARTGVGEIEEPLGCTLCGHRRVQPLFTARDRKRGRWSYHVVRCASCGFLFRNPGIQPERLGDLYAGRYGKFLARYEKKRRRRRHALVLDAFSPLFTEGGGRRLLDFGCGAGLFLEVAHERGFDGYGVDLSREAVAMARERPGGANAYFGAPRDVPEIAAGNFDVVTMWSVLAHLPRPTEDLSTLHELLAPDGVLLVLTVNANSLFLKARRSRWNGFTPNHLVFFSSATLALLLRNAGFKALLVRPMYGDSIESGTARLRSRHERRMRRNVENGNQGNMLRAVAFKDADGPRRWNFQRDAVAL